MPEANLFRPRQLRRVKLLRGVSGAAGGATGAVLYEDENGARYAVKHGNSGHAFLVVNEYVTYSLAREIDLRTPGFWLQRVEGQICILTEWVEESSHLGDVYQEDLRDLFEDWRDLLLLFGFDVFVMNTDRHDNNFLLLPGEEGFRICAIDHDRTLYGVTDEPVLLQAKHDGKPKAHDEQVALIQELQPRTTDFDPVIERIEAISNKAISTVISNIHDELLQAEDKQILSRILRLRNESKPGSRLISSADLSRRVKAMATAYYTIVRYVPDVARGEFMNVGAVVAMPEAEYLDFDLYATKTRLSQLDPYFEKNILENFRAYLKRKLRMYGKQLRIARAEAAEVNGRTAEGNPVEDVLDELVRVQKGGKFQFSAFQPVEMDIERPESIQAEILLNDLMEEYVEPPRRATKSKSRVPSLRAVFSKELRRFDLLNKGQGYPRVQAHYKLAADSKLDYDYGFRNGHVHVLELVDLIGHETPDEGGMSETGTALMKFIEAKEFAGHSGEEVEKYTVLRASESEIREFEGPLRMLRQVSAIYNIVNQEDMSTLIKRLQKALQAHEQNALGLG